MNVSDFFNHECDEVQRVAVQLQTFADQRDSGLINESEYKELCETTLSLDHIKQITDSMVLRSKAVEAFKQLAAIVGIFK